MFGLNREIALRRFRTVVWFAAAWAVGAGIVAVGATGADATEGGYNTDPTKG
jgi:hypothetical protein